MCDILSLVIDFSKLFHWNTKQLFLYMTIEYATLENPHNEMVIWDRIVQQKDFKRIDLHGFRSKYISADIADRLP